VKEIGVTRGTDNPNKLRGTGCEKPQRENQVWSDQLKKKKRKGKPKSPGSTKKKNQVSLVTKTPLV